MSAQCTLLTRAIGCPSSTEPLARWRWCPHMSISICKTQNADGGAQSAGDAERAGVVLVDAWVLVDEHVGEDAYPMHGHRSCRDVIEIARLDTRVVRA